MLSYAKREASARIVVALREIAQEIPEPFSDVHTAKWFGDLR
jgi:hypothetical protein